MKKMRTGPWKLPTARNGTLTAGKEMERLKG
jgi:hypothetical protein